VKAPALPSLYQFMPYGAPELKEVARKYMVRAVIVGSALWIVVFLLGLGTSAFLRSRPADERIIVVPYRELAAPPPLTQNEPPPQVQVQQQVAPPTVGVAVPVPDAEAPPEQTIASQEELQTATPGVETSGEGTVVIAPPSEEELPKFGEYVYVEELPEAITKVPPVYPDIAREAGVDGTVLVQALVDKNGRVKDVRVQKSIPMLDPAAIAAVKQWVFKPALSNNKPVAVWVAVPVRFTLH
jgi:protein TonB